jgi:hypothetical protein
MNTEQTKQPEAIASVPSELADTPKLGVPNAHEGVLEVAAASNLQAHHLKFADFHEAYVARYITLADSKATLVFGLMSGLLAYALGNKGNVTILLGNERSVLFWLLLTTVLLLAASAFCSVRVIAPRLFNSAAKGLVFFGAVANYPKAKDYVDVVARTDENSLTNARLVHCYDLSRVCKRKYLWLRAALWIGFAAIAGMVAALVWVP